MNHLETRIPIIQPQSWMLRQEYDANQRLLEILGAFDQLAPRGSQEASRFCGSVTWNLIIWGVWCTKVWIPNLAKPSPSNLLGDARCHAPKDILLYTGRMKTPYAYMCLGHCPTGPCCLQLCPPRPSRMAFQLLRLGNLIIAGVPGSSPVTGPHEKDWFWLNLNLVDALMEFSFLGICQLTIYFRTFSFMFSPWLYI